MYKRQNLPWLYLGYWIEDSRKMSYKSSFHPAQFLADGEWRDRVVPSP